MTVTINTDASHAPIRKVGGYAFWIKSSYGKVTHSGALIGEIYNSNEAELKAIANAFAALLKTVQCGKWPAVELIYLNTDSQHAIEMMKNPNKIRHDPEKQCVALVHSVIKELNAVVEYRKVRAHYHKKTKRHWVNDWCDKEAKKFTRLPKFKSKK
jgi:ribonuclease HI